MSWRASPATPPQALLSHTLEQFESGVSEILGLGVRARLSGGGSGDLGSTCNPSELTVVLALLTHLHLHLLAAPGLQLLHLLGNHCFMAQVQFEQCSLVLGTALGHRLGLACPLFGDTLLNLGQGKGMLTLAILGG